MSITRRRTLRLQWRPIIISFTPCSTKPVHHGSVFCLKWVPKARIFSRHFALYNSDQPIVGFTYGELFIPFFLVRICLAVYLHEQKNRVGLVGNSFEVGSPLTASFSLNTCFYWCCRCRFGRRTHSQILLPSMWCRRSIWALQLIRFHTFLSADWLWL